MEPFEITVVNILYHIEPQEDESFKVFEAGISVGTVFPEIEVNGTVWRSLDLITVDNAEKIGEQIENYYM